MSQHLNPDTVDRVRAAACTTAAQFVDEFQEPIDLESTDWDCVAWECDAKELGLDHEDRELWNTYQAELAAETYRLRDLDRSCG